MDFTVNVDLDEVGGVAAEKVKSCADANRYNLVDRCGGHKLALMHQEELLLRYQGLPLADEFSHAEDGRDRDQQPTTHRNGHHPVVASGDLHKQDHRAETDGNKHSAEPTPTSALSVAIDRLSQLRHGRMECGRSRECEWQCGQGQDPGRDFATRGDRNHCVCDQDTGTPGGNQVVGHCPTSR